MITNLAITIPLKIKNMLDFLHGAPSGAIVEVGVYKGGCLYILAQNNLHREVYGYDTWTGMPPHSELDNFHREGDFRADFQEVQNALSDLPNVILVKGLYPDSDIYKPRIALAHVDVDIHESTYKSCCHLVPLMVPGGRIYCDDALMETCEGATIAFEQFAREQGKTIKEAAARHCYLEF